jgi:hypothetical protein
MLIIAALYAILLWLVFFRLKLLRWGWVTGTLGVPGAHSSSPASSRCSTT